MSLAVKTVRQKHQASGELTQLLDEFRQMVNACITIGNEHAISSRRTLSSLAYQRLNRDMPGYYRLGAISAATSILRNYRKARKKHTLTRFPYAKKLMLTSCYGFKIVNDLLRLPVRPRRYVCFKLNGHTLQVLSGLNVRSVTLTQNAVSLSYSKEQLRLNRKDTSV